MVSLGSLRQRPPLRLGAIALLIFVLAFGALGGVATALMGPLATIVFAGLVLGSAGLLVPLPWLVVALVALSFLITGQLIYFARLEKALWFPFLLGALLLLRFPLDSALRRRGTAATAVQRSGNALLTGFMSIYFGALVASTLINASPPLQVFVSAKEYVFLWSLYALIAAGLIKPALVARLWAVLPWLMLLQLPLVVYQRFVIMPRRVGPSEFDAVVGAFGGDPSGGGLSSVMGFFSIIGIITVIARWRAGLAPGWQALVLGASGAIGIALAEIKFMVILLPIAFCLLFIRELGRRPLQSIVMIVVGLSLSSGILFAYKLQYGPKFRGGTSVAEYVEEKFRQNTEGDQIDMHNGEIGRITAILLWYKKHDIRDPMPMLLGHGAGSSRAGSLVVGVVQQNYAFSLTRSAVSVLLWEVGVIGTLAFVGILISACLMLFRQGADTSRSAETRATSASMAVAVAILVASLVYDKSLVSVHQILIMLMLCLGYATVMNGRLASDAVMQKPLRAPALRPQG